MRPLLLLLILMPCLSIAQNVDSLYGWKRDANGFIEIKKDTVRARVLVSRPGCAAIEVDGWILLEESRPVGVLRRKLSWRGREKKIPMRSWTNIWMWLDLTETLDFETEKL